MIDCESFLFDELSIGLEEEFPEVFVSPYAMRVADKLPCVFVKEASNYPYARCSDSGKYENVSSITFEINVYANGVNRKKTCKDIIQKVDEILIERGFKRGMRNPIEFLEDNTLYRMIVRYSGLIKEVDGKFIVYRGG